MMGAPFCRKLDRGDKRASIHRQCVLLDAAASRFYRAKKPANHNDFALTRCIQEADRVAIFRFVRNGDPRVVDGRVSRERVRTLTRRLGLAAVTSKPNATIQGPGYKICHFLPRDLTVERPSHVWRRATTNFPVGNGCLHLVVGRRLGGNGWQFHRCLYRKLYPAGMKPRIGRCLALCGICSNGVDKLTSKRRATSTPMFQIYATAAVAAFQD